METKIIKRTFKAKNYPKGSKERNLLNMDVITSEYMPSYKYVLFNIIPETDIYYEMKHIYTFRTKKEAIEKEKKLTSKI